MCLTSCRTGHGFFPSDSSATGNWRTPRPYRVIPQSWRVVQRGSGEIYRDEVIIGPVTIAPHFTEGEQLNQTEQNLIKSHRVILYCARLFLRVYNYRQRRLHMKYFLRKRLLLTFFPSFESPLTPSLSRNLEKRVKYYRLSASPNVRFPNLDEV